MINPKLKECLRDLQKLNSTFSDTKEFLNSKGLVDVDQLDEDGMRELIVFLLKGGFELLSNLKNEKTRDKLADILLDVKNNFEKRL